VNREANGGWRVRQNISLLCWCPQARPAASLLYETGDVLVIWSRPDTSDAHALVVLEQDDPHTIRTAEYGQPGAKLKRHSILGGRIGHRALQRHIPLEAVLNAAIDAEQLESIDGPAVLAEFQAIGSTAWGTDV
jgi:hypothetical protein